MTDDTTTNTAWLQPPAGVIAQADFTRQEMDDAADMGGGPTQQALQAACREYDAATAAHLDAGAELSPRDAHAAGIGAVVRHAVAGDYNRKIMAFAETYSRSNEIIDGTYDDVDAQLAEIADKAAGTLKKFLTSMHEGREREIDFPIAALTNLLAVVAGTRAAFEMTATPTGVDVVDEIRAENVTSPAYNQLRLHLLSTHCNLAALNLTDRDAQAYHHAEHYESGGLRSHDFDDHDWSKATIDAVISEAGVDTREALAAKAAEMIASLSPATAVSGG